MTTIEGQRNAPLGAAQPDLLARVQSTRTRAGAALIALVAIALLPTLFAPFFADDYFHIEVASNLSHALAHGWVLPIASAGAWWTPHGLSVQYFRPLVVLSFAADDLLYGHMAAGYHLTNLALHGVGTLLVWAIARRILGRGFGAWAAAALFAIHPCHTLAVGWVSGRTDVMAGVFYLAAFLAFLEGRPSPRRTTPCWKMWALSLFFFALSLTAKEMALTFPLIILAHNGLKPEGQPLSRRLVAPGLAAAAAALYLAFRVWVLGGLKAPPTPFAFHLGDPGLLRHLVTAPFLYLADFVLFVPPDPMATEPFWTAHTFLFVVFVGVVLVTFSGTLKKAPDRRIAAWGLGWMGITLLPVATLTVGEHFLYLPSVGYCILVGSQLPADAARIDAKARRALAIVGSLVVIVCLVRTTMFTDLSRTSSRAIDETASLLDGSPAATLLLMDDLPAAAALAFPHAIKLARPARSVKVEILSLLPRVVPNASDRSIVTFSSPEHLEIRRRGGFLHSYLERAFEGPHIPFRAGQVIDRGGYTVTILDVSGGHIDRFGVHLADPAHTLVLRSTPDGTIATLSHEVPSR
ncbi:MAG: hypothetical protein ACREJ3_03200 [Polyangiaceae bacterium]